MARAFNKYLVSTDTHASYCSRSVDLCRGQLRPLGDSEQCLQTLLIVTTGEQGGLILACHG